MKLRKVFQYVATALLATGIFVQVAAAPPADYLEAVEICDRADLRPVEGLWTYPDDDVTVMIYRSEDVRGAYDIFVVEAADCSLKPGMRIGELRESPDPDKFNMQLFTNIKKGKLSMPVSAAATFSESKEALTVKKSSPLKIRFNPTRLLPSFWRLVSVSFKTNESAPEGMIKVYPSYDGNMSSRRSPRYL